MATASANLSLQELIPAQIVQMMNSFYQFHKLDHLLVSSDNIKISKCSQCPGEMFITFRSIDKHLDKPRDKHHQSSPWPSFIQDIQKHIKHMIITNNETTPIYIDEAIIRDNRIIYFKLNRTILFKQTIVNVLKLQEDYTNNNKQETINRHKIIICPVHRHGNIGCYSDHDDHNVDVSCDGDGMSLEDGRVLMVSRLLTNLLGSVHTIETMRSLSLPINTDCSSSKHVQEILNSFLQQKLLVGTVGDVAMDTMITKPANMEKLESNFIARIGLNNEMDSNELLIVNGIKYLHDNDIEGHSSNINTIEVMKHRRITIVGRMASILYNTVCTMATIGTESVVIVTNHRNSFLCQQVIILTRMALAPCNVQFKIIEVGSVTLATPTLLMNNYVGVKMAEVTRSCEIKYGKIEKDSTLKNIVSCMTNAAVKFDMLGTDPRKTLKLEVSDCSPGAPGDTRSNGTFVLYNYARLSTLVTNYKENSIKGIYPPLPADFDNIDYTLLKEQEEWTLLYWSVFLFPAILKESSDFIQNNSPVFIQSGLKKLCQFLSTLCHMFSGYYSRVKILLGPEPHLQPLIQARITLVMALKQVLYNGLQLLGIEPLEQL